MDKCTDCHSFHEGPRQDYCRKYRTWMNHHSGPCNQCKEGIDGYKPEHKIYLEGEEIELEYCKQINCNLCHGTEPESYEPRGYGCEAAEKFAIKYAHLSVEDMSEDDFNKIRGYYEQLEQENRELQISCDGFAEQSSKLEAKIHNIEEGLKQLEDVLKTLNVKIGYSHHTDMYYLDGDLIDGGYVILPSATTLADLIDKLTGGE